MLGTASRFIPLKRAAAYPTTTGIRQLAQVLTEPVTISSSRLNSCLLIDTTATAHLPRPRAQGEWRPHDHHRELRAWRRTARPALAQSRARHRDAMTLVTTSSYCTPAGEPRFRPCTIVAPPPPKPPLTPSIRPRSPSRPPPRRQSRHRNRRSDGNYAGQRIPYSSRRPAKFP